MKIPIESSCHHPHYARCFVKIHAKEFGISSPYCALFTDLLESFVNPDVRKILGSLEPYK